MTSIGVKDGFAVGCVLGVSDGVVVGNEVGTIVGK